jgi:hypothetical protein
MEKWRLKIRENRCLECCFSSALTEDKTQAVNSRRLSECGIAETTKQTKPLRGSLPMGIELPCASRTLRHETDLRRFGHVPVRTSFMVARSM